MRDTRELINGFQAVFGGRPELLAFAPGRVNLIGEHTDYNGGHVFPCALELGVSCAAKKREDDVLRFYSLDVPDAGVIELRLGELAPLRTKQWSCYPEGVIHAMREEGCAIGTGADMLFYGDIPAGMGLSSSAALEVVTGAALNGLFDLGLSNQQLALFGKTAENRYAGVNCGIMDQFASAMGKAGHAIFLDTASLKYRYAPLQLDDEELVIVDSRVKHSLAGSAYNDRRRGCEQALRDLQNRLNVASLGALSPAEFELSAELITDPVCRRRARHAVYENARTITALEALERGMLDEFGKLMNASHVSLRDDYEVSCEELDVLTEIAWSLPGVVGARMTGGGFGGCMIAIVKKHAVDEFVRQVRERYLERTGLEAGFIIAKPGEGAHILDIE